MNFKQFAALGETIRRRLFQANDDECQLAPIAASALSCAKLETDFDLGAIAEFLRTTQIKQQPGTTFSNLPPIVYRCDSFYIELLVWTEASTTVHEHAFSGAFRVLVGSSIHTEYEFEQGQRISSRLLLGRTRFKGIELLKQGDVRRIRSGRNGLLHGLFHLDRPSVTLVVRDIEPWATPQYSILKPSFAYAEEELAADARVSLICRLLSVARTLNPSQATQVLIEQVPRLDFPRLFMILKSNHQLLNREEDWENFLARVRHRHGKLAEYLIDVVQTARCEWSILTTRDDVTDPDLRFF